MFRQCFAVLMCLMCVSAQAEDKFQFEDGGYRLESRYGDVYESGGFKVAGKGKNGIRTAIRMAEIQSARQDNRYNMAINEIGEAGHGISAPIIVEVRQRPVYIPVPVEIPVFRPLYGYPPYNYPYYYR